MELKLLRSGLVLIGIVLVLMAVLKTHRKNKLTEIAYWLLGALAIANILFYGFLSQFRSPCKSRMDDMRAPSLFRSRGSG